MSENNLHKIGIAGLHYKKTCLHTKVEHAQYGRKYKTSNMAENITDI